MSYLSRQKHDIATSAYQSAQTDLKEAQDAYDQSVKAVERAEYVRNRAAEEVARALDVERKAWADLQETHTQEFGTVAVPPCARAL